MNEPVTADRANQSTRGGAEQSSSVLFGGPVGELDAGGYEAIAMEVPTTDVAADELEGAAVVDLLVRTGLAKSKGDARRTIEQGGVYVAGEPVADVAATVGGGDLAGGRYVLLRRGKSTYHLLRVRG